MKNLLTAELVQHHSQIAKSSLSELFVADPQRAAQLHLVHDGLYFDFSKNNIRAETLDLLINLATSKGLAAKIQELFNGAKLNNTEQRAVLHTALRSERESILVDGKNVIADIRQVKQQMASFCESIHSGQHLGYSGKKITTIVNLGIGGSDLGPVLVTQALKPYAQPDMAIHFISSVDGYLLKDTLAGLDPETTLFIVASKTFTTQETMTNAHSARNWFLAQVAGNDVHIAQHFIALSTNIEAAIKFGIAEENIFAFWDFVGGRYSLCSAIGLSIALYIGFANYAQLLAGAHSMDEHFSTTTDLRQNLPVILALIGVWYINFFDYRSLVISPYNTRLTRFPAYIQQLEMESNGKSVTKAGEKINYATCPVVWGDSGINGQHAYYQLLHQGTQIVPMDIIVALSDEFSLSQHNDILWSNAIAQAEALMQGKSYATALQELIVAGYSVEAATELAKHKVFPGNRPSNMLILPEISPYYLGKLIALYEHKTFVQGVIWDINSFDQMGVELGKQLAKTVLNDITSGEISVHDSSTVALIQHYLQRGDGSHKP